MTLTGRVVARMSHFPGTWCHLAPGAYDVGNASENTTTAVSSFAFPPTPQFTLLPDIALSEPAMWQHHKQQKIGRTAMTQLLAFVGVEGRRSHYNLGERIFLGW